MTQLPRRNPFLLVLYMLAVISMFVFIAWIVLFPYDGYETEQTASPAYTNTQPVQPQNNPQPVQTRQPAENTNTVAGLVPEQRQPLRLAAVTSQLNLQQSLGPQIERAWQRFISADLLSKTEISNSLRVHALYHNYNPETQQLSMSIGYVVAEQGYIPAGVEELQVNGGRYLRLPGETVLDNWNNPQRFGSALSYSNDYEIYLLDENYQVKSQVAFLAVTGQ